MNWGGHILQIDLHTDKVNRLDNIPGDVDPLSLRLSPDGRHLSFKSSRRKDQFYFYDTRTKKTWTVPIRPVQMYSDYGIGYYRRLHHRSRIRDLNPKSGSGEKFTFPVMSPYTWINGEELIYTADDESLIRLNAVKKILKIVGEGCVFRICFLPTVATSCAKIVGGGRPTAYPSTMSGPKKSSTSIDRFFRWTLCCCGIWMGKA